MFIPPAWGYTPARGSFVSVSPCRAVDTRLSTLGDFGSPSLVGEVKRDFVIKSSPNCSGIPSGVRAYALNITAVPLTSSLAYLTVWPAGLPQPFVSTLNSWSGDVVANSATVAAGDNGAISVYATANTDLIIDVTGYYADLANAGPAGFAGDPGPAGPQGLPGLMGAVGPVGLTRFHGSAWCRWSCRPDRPDWISRSHRP
ncbi:MAG: collagen-like protein [Bryobacteraceae bacterium]